MKNNVGAGHLPFLKDIFHQVKETAASLWQKGWAEGSAGNMSVDITQLGDYAGLFNHAVDHTLSDVYPELAGRIVLITAAGSRMRELAQDPVAGTGLISFNKQGDSYRAVASGNDDNIFVPSSELATHLTVLARLAGNNAPEKAVIHAHALELTALTYLDEYNDEQSINELLWSLHPEVVMFLPRGMGLIPFSLSGSVDATALTAAKMLMYHVVIWEKHGCLAAGADLPSAFDNIDIAAAAARIFLQCRSAGYTPTGLNDKQIAALKDRYFKC
jgi:rhamnulose-1-phosphate aldolase